MKNYYNIILSLTILSLMSVGWGDDEESPVFHQNQSNPSNEEPIMGGNGRDLEWENFPISDWANRASGITHIPGDNYRWIISPAHQKCKKLNWDYTDTSESFSVPHNHTEEDSPYPFGIVADDIYFYIINSNYTSNIMWVERYMHDGTYVDILIDDDDLQDAGFCCGHFGITGITLDDSGNLYISGGPVYQSDNIAIFDKTTGAFINNWSNPPFCPYGIEWVESFNYDDINCNDPNGCIIVSQFGTDVGNDCQHGEGALYIYNIEGDILYGELPSSGIIRQAGLDISEIDNNGVEQYRVLSQGHFASQSVSQLIIPYPDNNDLGCTDPSACNYNPDAIEDDGNCAYEEDCAGECGGSAEQDECGVCDGNGSSCGESTISLEIQNVDINTGTLDIYLINTEEVGGFQFQLTNIEITGAYGGVAQDSGFILNTSGTDTPSGISKVLGFSLTGATIPVGEGVLTTVTFTDFNNENICFGEDTGSAGMNAIASATGGYIAADWGECYTDDCDGIYDCLGYCEGDAVEDECGVCGGDGADIECWDGSMVCDPADCPIDPGGWDGDACTMPPNAVHLTSGGSVLFNTDTPLGGFQMNVDGATIASAGGGEAEAAGFMVSTVGSTVLGFSLTGATIDGCGTLVELELDGDATGLSGIIISDSFGSQLYFEYYDGGADPIYGCMDESACNYDPDATEDDGSCAYEEDCAGECGGGAVEDECGVCGGDNSSCADCAGVPNGDNELDNCGICDNDPSNDCAQDCAGDWGGDAEQDECGVCNGDGSTCEDFGGVSLEIQNVDTDAGTLDIYMSNYSGCSYCEDPSYTNNSQNWTDKKELCEYIGSTWVAYDPITEAECSAIPSLTGNGGWWFNGEVGGFQFELPGVTGTGASAPAGFTTSISSSTVMGFSLTGATIPLGSGILTQVSFSNFDGEICFGDDTGTAGNNVIADASGGYIGTTWGPCYCGEYDECGVCGGDDSSCLDCADVPNGDSVMDNCGTCDNDSSNDCVQDCNGDWGGTAEVDECGVCDGGIDSFDDCADISVRPDSLSADLNSGESATQTLTISNDGGSDLEWSTMSFMEDRSALAGYYANLGNVQISENNVTMQSPSDGGYNLTRDYYYGDYINFGVSEYGEIMPFNYNGVEVLELGCWLSGYSIVYNISDSLYFASAYYDFCCDPYYSDCDGRINLLPISYTDSQSEDTIEIDVTVETEDGNVEIHRHLEYITTDKFVRITTDIRNVSGEEITDITFRSFADWDSEMEIDNDWGFDSTRILVYAKDPYSQTYTSIATSTIPSLIDVDGWGGDLGGITQPNNTEVLPPGEYFNIDGLEVLEYDYSVINDGGSQKVLTAYIAGSSLEELQAVYDRTFNNWFALDPTSGTIPAGSSEDVIVTFDATDLIGGDYTADITITSNDPDESEVTVPVSLTVTGDASECDSPVCLSIQNVDTLARTLDIYMENSEPVGGFQFEIFDVEMDSAFGGSAAENDFSISINSDMILGFSLTGASIPAGSGLLTSISFSNYLGYGICFGSNPINNAIVDALGYELETDWNCWGDDTPIEYYYLDNGNYVFNFEQDSLDYFPVNGYQPEWYDDENANGEYDEGEYFEDLNGNGIWDTALWDIYYHFENDSLFGYLNGELGGSASYYIDITNNQFCIIEDDYYQNDNGIIPFHSFMNRETDCLDLIFIDIENNIISFLDTWYEYEQEYSIIITFSPAVQGCLDTEACNFDDAANTQLYDLTLCEYDCPESPAEFSFNQSSSQAFYFVMSATDMYTAPLESGDWIGLFNGDVCVGSREWPGEAVDIPTMGDDGFEYSEGYLQIGDIPTFKIYDASEDMIYSAIPSDNFAFADAQIFFVDELSGMLGYELSLNGGANLVSFYTLPDDNSIANVIGECPGNITGVLTEGMAAACVNDQWIGTLIEIDLTDGYWILANNSDTLSGYGTNYDPGRVYDLHYGANLISYSSLGSADLSSSIPDDVEDLFLGILSGGYAAMNTDSLGWVGSLTTFDAHMGYWIIVSDDLSFSYETGSMARSDIRRYIETRPSGSAFEVAQSPNQAFYFVDTITLDEGVIEDGDWLLSYNGHTLTGIRQWQGVMIDIPAMGISESKGTEGYFKAGDLPTFKLFKQSTGDLIPLGGDIIPAWTENGMYALSSLSEMQPIPEEFVLNSAYPNPFNPVTKLEFGIPVDGDVSIEVYNLQGRVVEVLVKRHMEAGYHSVTWNADNHSSGMYFVQLISEDFVTTQKLMLLK